jgi:GNAT superfamily N-acetyltransferase
VTNPGDNQAAIKIRRARSSDAAQIAELCGQLGYPAKPAEITGRLRTIKPARQHAVLVAELSEGNKRKLIGWLHVSVAPLVEVELRAEVNGLVVDTNERSRGTGALLLRGAEQWARSRGCRSVSVRSNVVRERAHQFYLRHGYEHYKTQKAFRKPL